MARTRSDDLTGRIALEQITYSQLLQLAYRWRGSGWFSGRFLSESEQLSAFALLLRWIWLRLMGGFGWTGPKSRRSCGRCCSPTSTSRRRLLPIRPPETAYRNYVEKGTISADVMLQLSTALAESKSEGCKICCPGERSSPQAWIKLRSRLWPCKWEEDNACEVEMLGNT